MNFTEDTIDKNSVIFLTDANTFVPESIPESSSASCAKNSPILRPVFFPKIRLFIQMLVATPSAINPEIKV